MDKLPGTTWKVLACAAAVALLLACGYFVYKNRSKPSDTEVVTHTQAMNGDFLENHFKIPTNQTKETVRYIERAQTGVSQPAATFIVQAPSTGEAARQVEQRIREQDETLPAAAIKKADKTIIAEQPENKEHEVGVYKINLRRDHKIKVGAAYVDNKAYWTAGYQNRRMEYTVMMQDKKLKGEAVQYTVAEW